METKINLYKKIERPVNDVELVGGKSWICITEAEYVTTESMLQQNLGLNHMTLGQNRNSPYAYLTN